MTTTAHPAGQQAGPARLTDVELAAVRADFPLLERTVRGGRPLVYLDSAATSQKPQVVLDTEVDFYEERNAAVHRGAHQLAEEATEAFEDARDDVAALVGARPGEIVWTSGATAAINLVAYGISNATLGRGERRPAASRSRRATRSSSPRRSTTRTSSRGRSSRPAPGPSCAGSRWTTTAACASRTRRPSSPSAPASWPSRTCRT